MSQSSLDLSGAGLAGAADKPAAAVATGPYSVRYAWYVVGFLFLANVLNFVDRKLPFILVESIKNDLALTDTQIGLVGGVMFTGTAAVTGVVLARVADRFSRKMVLLWSLLVWSALTAAGGAARGFADFAAARMGVAVAESGASPPSQSMISDYFPPQSRALALSVFAAASSVGFMGAMMLGGWLNDIANWRVAMFAVGAPGVLLAIVGALTVREPPRGVSEGLSAAVSQGTAPKLMQVFAEFFRKGALVCLVTGATCFSIAGTGITGFAAAFFIRTHGLSTSETGFWLGLCLGVGSGAGAVFGGYVSDRAGRTDSRFRLWAPAIIKLVSIPLLASAFLAPDHQLAIPLLGLALFFTAAYVAPAVAVTHSLVLPRMRATASAVMLLVTQGVGASLGPLLVGMMSDAWAPTVGAESLRYALLGVLAATPIGCLLYFLAGSLLPRDLALTRNQATSA